MAFIFQWVPSLLRKYSLYTSNHCTPPQIDLGPHFNPPTHAPCHFRYSPPQSESPRGMASWLHTVRHPSHLKLPFKTGVGAIAHVRRIPIHPSLYSRRQWWVWGQIQPGGRAPTNERAAAPVPDFLRALFTIGSYRCGMRILLWFSDCPEFAYLAQSANVRVDGMAAAQSASAPANTHTHGGMVVGERTSLRSRVDGWMDGCSVYVGGSRQGNEWGGNRYTQPNLSGGRFHFICR